MGGARVMSATGILDQTSPLSRCVRVHALTENGNWIDVTDTCDAVDVRAVAVRQGTVQGLQWQHYPELTLELGAGSGPQQVRAWRRLGGAGKNFLTWRPVDRARGEALSTAKLDQKGGGGGEGS